MIMYKNQKISMMLSGNMICGPQRCSKKGKGGYLLSYPESLFEFQLIFRNLNKRLPYMLKILRDMLRRKYELEYPIIHAF